MEESEIQHSFFRWDSRRFHIILLLMSGMTLFYFARASIGISMICMVNTTSSHNNENNDIEISKKCYNIFINSNNASKSHKGTFNWSIDTQNLIISANYWGSLFTTLIAGILVDKTSPKKIIIFSSTILLITTAAFPTFADNWNHNAIIFLRFIFGFGDAFWPPSFNHILSNWIPITEKSLAVGIYTSGVQISAILGNPIAALFCNSSFGWSGTFYFSSFLILIFIILWISLVQPRFDKGKWLTKKELIYLSQNMIENKRNKVGKKYKILWYEIIKSLPLLSILFCRVSEMIFIVFSTTFLPLYLRDTLYINIIDNGIYSAVPFVAQMFSKITIGILVLKLQKKKIINSTQSVKICQFISGVGVMIGLLIIPYISHCEYPFKTVISFGFVLFFFGISANGFFTSIYMLSPPLIGSITSLNVFVGIFGAGSTSYLISYLKNFDKLNGWNIVLRFIGIIWFITSIFFTIFGSGEKQNWIKEINEDKDEENSLINKKSSDNSKLKDVKI